MLKEKNWISSFHSVTKDINKASECLQMLCVDYTPVENNHGKRNVIFSHYKFTLCSNKVDLKHGGVVLCLVQWRHFTSCIFHIFFSKISI